MALRPARVVNSDPALDPAAPARENAGPVSSQTKEAPDSATRRAGLGLLLITSAKVVFIVSGFGVALALPRLFGSEEVFGLFSVAFGAASILNNVLITSTVQTVSKIVGDDEARAKVALRHGLVVQAIVGTTLAAVLVLGAPFLAEAVFRDAALTSLVRIAGGVAFAYALYATLVGYLNGCHRFLHQAGLDMTFSILRTTGLIAGAALGVGALGAMGGFGIAAGAILCIAAATIGLGSAGGMPSAKRWIGLMLPIWFYQACVQGILQIDLQVLKYSVTDLGIASGLAESAAVEAANVLAGNYRAAQTFAFVPYQLILSVTFIVFPFVSRATTSGDAEATKRYVQNAMRFSLVVLLAMAAPIAGAASGVLRIAYPAEYLVGADALAVLVVGQVGFALFVIGATILTGSGRPMVAAAIAFVALIVVIAATSIAIRMVGLEGHRALLATAIGTSIGTGVALVLIALALKLGLGAFVPLPTAIRAGIAAGAAFMTARFIPHDGALGAIVALAGGSIAYVVVLAVTREIGAKDVEVVRTILRRRKKA
jgi:stage V sporulation protein B